MTTRPLDSGRSPDDRRVTRLGLTPKAQQSLLNLSALHLEELVRLAPQMQTIWKDRAGAE